MKILNLSVLFLSIITSNLSIANDESSSPRLVVHLLDYLAKDYSGAVEDGKIKSVGEYAEQQEFAATVVQTVHKIELLAGDKTISDGVTNLSALIDAKAPANEVAQLARLLQANVIKAAALNMVPNLWPKVSNGRALFAQNCVSCHGESGRGDGPGAAGLGPQPANFMAAGMVELSPFQAFNTIRIGVPGTGMPAFSQMSDAEIWDLAFLVISMRYTNSAAEGEGLSFDSEQLQRVATKSDEALSRELSLPEGDTKVIAALRLHEQDDNAFPGIAESNLRNALVASREGRHEEAKTFALKAYLEGVEPNEARIRASDPDAVIRIEDRMSAVRGSLEDSKPIADTEHLVRLAIAELRSAATIFQNKGFSPYMAFISAAAIIMREGFEAVLLILALLGVIRAASAARAARWVHGGWLAAVACGIVSWFLSGYLLTMSGAGREMMEAVTALFAVAVLLYVGFWMHRQTEIGRWRAFLDGKVKKLLEGKNLLGLAFISFLAVFRESFETVLFLRSIAIESGSDGQVAMFGGVLVSFSLLLLFAWLLLRSSKKLPIRKLFSISAVVMGILAVMLTGNGLHSLQEAGKISVHSTPLHFRFDLLGVYPTWQTLIGQLSVICVLAAIWIHGNQPSAKAVIGEGADVEA